MKLDVLKTSLLVLIFLVACFSFTVKADVVFNLTPIDDAFVDSSQPNLTANVTYIRVGSSTAVCVPANPELWRIYLKFDLTGYQIANLTNVTLRMITNQAEDYCTTGVDLWNTSCSWSEGNITWNNQCSLSTTIASNPNVGTLAGAGMSDYFSSEQLVNYTRNNIGSDMSLAIVMTGGGNGVFAEYGSKEGNPNYIPQLVLTYSSVDNTTVPAGTSGIINYVKIDDPVFIGSTHTATISFTNTGPNVGRFKVGFSIGNNTKGFCNTDCYVGGDLDPFSGTVWFAIVNAGPGETRVVSLPYTYLANHFDENNTYTVLSTIRPSNTFDILDNFTTTVTVNAVQPASANITVVTYPSPFATVDQSYNISVAFVNTGNFTSSYKVGLSIGKNSTGFCNSACYMPLGSGGYFDPYTGTRWLGSATLNPGEMAVVKLPFMFRSDFYTQLGFYQDVRVTIRPISTLDILDSRTYNNAIIPVNFPSTLSAKIVNVTLSDYSPTIDQVITANIKVMNNGSEAAEFPVGFSIGKDGVFCNRDCYTDCISPPNPAPPSAFFCDYKSTGLIHPNQSVTITRQFKMNQLNFEQGQTYDIISSVSYFTYSSPALSYDYKVFSNAVNISDVSTKLNGYAISAFATPTSVQVRNVTSLGEDIISFDIAVVNNASLTYNYTIGLSIGLWNATNGGVYYAALPDIVPPCNSQCYTDGRGDWETALIPSGYSAPIHRTMRVPHYLLEGTSFDIAVGLWTSPPNLYPSTNVGKLISITYFKNIASIRPPSAFGSGITPTIGNSIGSVIGISMEAALGFLALLISTIATAFVGYKTKNGVVSGITFIGCLTIFSFMTWVPIWIPVMFAVLTAFIVARFGKSFIG